MIYPPTPPRNAPARTAQVTRAGAYLLNQIAQHAAVHACELTGHEALVRSLLQEHLLLCRTTRIGQVLSLSSGGCQHLGLSRRDLTSPATAATAVYRRAALHLVADGGFAPVRPINQYITEITDGHRRSWMYATGKINAPSPDVIDKVIIRAGTYALNGTVIVVADDVSAYRQRTSAFTAFRHLPFSTLADRLPPIPPLA